MLASAYDREINSRDKQRQTTVSIAWCKGGLAKKLWSVPYYFGQSKLRNLITLTPLARQGKGRAACGASRMTEMLGATARYEHQIT